MLSLFTGAGGLDLGFEAAGFATRAAIELDPDARATIEMNRPTWGLLEEGDITKVNLADIESKFSDFGGSIDVLIAGPPCQPFSKSAYWAHGDTRRLEDERASTIIAMMDVAEATLPRAVVIENVKGIGYKAKDEGLRYIRRRFRRINAEWGTAYRTTAITLNATEFGVPQARERTFIIAMKDGSRFLKPLQTHAGETISDKSNLKPPVRAWDALGGLNVSTDEQDDLRLSGKWADLIPTIPEGQNYLWHTSRGGGVPLFGWRTRYWSFLLKLAKDQPAWTIQASPGPATGPFHWDNRLLSVREMARLQSFPHEIQFAGAYRSARKQIGNAVPPALAEAVANRLLSHLTGSKYCREVSLAISRRSDLPKQTPHQQLPSKYLCLRGDHQAHPGHGLGPAALRRESSSVSAS